MVTTTKIIDILKNDPKANELITILNRAANQNKFTDEQYNNARKMMLLISIQNNPEAFQVLSDNVYNKINGGN